MRVRIMFYKKKKKIKDVDILHLFLCQNFEKTGCTFQGENIAVWAKQLPFMYEEERYTLTTVIYSICKIVIYSLSKVRCIA